MTLIGSAARGRSAGGWGLQGKEWLAAAGEDCGSEDRPYTEVEPKS